MPRYIYECEECHEEFMAFHLISEDLKERDGCSGACNLHRIPQLTRDMNKIKNKTKKVGQVVDEYIKETKREIDHTKKERMKID